MEARPLGTAAGGTAGPAAECPRSTPAASALSRCRVSVAGLEGAQSEVIRAI